MIFLIHLQHKREANRGNGGNNHKGQAVQKDHANKAPQQPSRPSLKQLELISQILLVVGDTDPVIGRDEEIIRVIEILNRRTRTTLFSSVSLVLVKNRCSRRLTALKLLTVMCHKTRQAASGLDVVSLVQGLVSAASSKNACKNSWKKFVNARMLSLWFSTTEMQELVMLDDGNMDAGNILKPALAVVNVEQQH